MKIKVPPLFAGQQPSAYLVGGSVRDLIRGLTPADYDIAVCSDPCQFAEEFAKRNGGRLVILSKDRYALYRVVSPQWRIDITFCKNQDIRSDLMTRDFTINAMACTLQDGRVIDVTDGLTDLNSGVVRMVSPSVFQADPARLVRAFRMAATLNFTIHPETIDAIRAHAKLLGKTAGERVWAELIRILGCSDSHPHLHAMAETRILDAIFPELTALRQIRRQTSDMLEQTLKAIHALEQLFGNPKEFLRHKPSQFIEKLKQEERALLKMSILMHAIGRTACRRKGTAGLIHFRGFAVLSAEQVQTIGRRLRMSNRQRQYIAFMVCRVQCPLFLYRSQNSNPLPPAAALGRFFRQCGSKAPHLLILAMAVHMAASDPTGSEAMRFNDFLAEILSLFYQRNLDQGLAPILNGRDLIIHFRLHPSPMLGNLLRSLEELHLGGVITDRQQALDWVAEHLKC